MSENSLPESPSLFVSGAEAEPNASVLAKFRGRQQDDSERLRKLEQRKELAAHTTTLLNAQARELKRIEGVKKAQAARRKNGAEEAN